MEQKIIDTLLNLTKRKNDSVKIAAIFALGDCQILVDKNNTVDRLLELCNDPNRDVAISAIKTICKISNKNLG